MHSFVLVVHIILAVLMIALILVQHGKGADAGASFGGGGAATVFGASGSGNFLTRVTAILIALCFVTSLTLAVFAKKQT
ncbi:preprotein translocase subunit SecG, partial [Acinetobacter baumannii]|uniref:preprotein translocase subunit SecG n=1 Tax=Acinetobacter baumannii TaxID=470 RepID=UPI003D13F233